MLYLNSILNTYPPDELVIKMKELNRKNLNVYIDLKNISTCLFLETVAQEIVQNSELSDEIDTSIFQSIIYYASWWKEFGYNNDFNVNVFFCNDKGQSIYHLNIDKKYKENRRISSESLPLYFKDLIRIKDINNEMARSVCGKIPGVYFFNLRNLEADFLSYYLITRKFNDKDTIHIICSSDKDMYQSLIQDNIFLLYKIKTINKYLSRNNVLHHYLQLDNKSEKSKQKTLELMKNITSDDIILLMSITGDMGDNVPGVKGIGPLKALELFKERELVNKHIGTSDEVLERVIKENSFFKNLDNIDEKKLTKNWSTILKENELITSAFKLISFEHLCKWLESRSGLFQIERLKSIDEVLNYKTMNNDKVFKEPKSLFLGLNKIKQLKLTLENLNPFFA